MAERDDNTVDVDQPSLLSAPMGRALSSVAGPLIGLVLVVVIFGALNPSRFLHPGNFSTVTDANYHLAVAAIGATFVVITGGIDLSVGSTMAFAGVCCAMAIRGLKMPPREPATMVALPITIAALVGLCVAARGLTDGRKMKAAITRGAAFAGGAAVLTAILWLSLAGRTFQPASPWTAAVVGVCAGTLVGYLNGSLITSLGLPPFVVTLATLQAIRGLSLYLTEGQPVSVEEIWPPAAKASMKQLERLHYGSFLGISPNAWVTLGLAALLAPLLHFTIVGRYAYAIGSNERTARLCGVPVERYKTLCYVIAGLTAGIAGVMACGKLVGGQPTEFRGAELNIIAAVVIGGTSLFGGEGTIVGTILGVLMLGLLDAGCTLAGISAFLQPIFIGGTILLAAALDRFRHLRK